ncbi:unnamed protein product [Amoebophrya sp. A25]|nr:unnamed protein product [Amoebophrya sp. A25]|eukprot:GSA25T00019580001.1
MASRTSSITSHVLVPSLLLKLLQLSNLLQLHVVVAARRSFLQKRVPSRKLEAEISSRSYDASFYVEEEDVLGQEEETRAATTSSVSSPVEKKTKFCPLCLTDVPDEEHEDSNGNNVVQFLLPYTCGHGFCSACLDQDGVSAVAKVRVTACCPTCSASPVLSQRIAHDIRLQKPRLIRASGTEYRLALFTDCGAAQCLQESDMNLHGARKRTTRAGSSSFLQKRQWLVLSDEAPESLLLLERDVALRENNCKYMPSVHALERSFPLLTTEEVTETFISGVEDVVARSKSGLREHDPIINLRAHLWLYLNGVCRRAEHGFSTTSFSPRKSVNQDEQNRAVLEVPPEECPGSFSTSAVTKEARLPAKALGDLVDVGPDEVSSSSSSPSFGQEQGPASGAALLGGDPQGPIEDVGDLNFEEEDFEEGATSRCSRSRASSTDGIVNSRRATVVSVEEIPTADAALFWHEICASPLSLLATLFHPLVRCCVAGAKRDQGGRRAREEAAREETLVALDHILQGMPETTHLLACQEKKPPSAVVEISSAGKSSADGGITTGTLHALVTGGGVILFSMERLQGCLVVMSSPEPSGNASGLAETASWVPIDARTPAESRESCALARRLLDGVLMRTHSDHK